MLDSGAVPATAETAASESPGVPSGVSTAPARTATSLRVAYAPAVVCTMPEITTAKLTVTSTGAAVDAVRRTALSAFCRTSSPIAPPRRTSGRASGRTTSGMTAGASRASPTINTSTV